MKEYLKKWIKKLENDFRGFGFSEKDIFDSSDDYMNASYCLGYLNAYRDILKKIERGDKDVGEGNN